MLKCKYHIMDDLPANFQCHHINKDFGLIACYIDFNKTLVLSKGLIIMLQNETFKVKYSILNGITHDIYNLTDCISIKSNREGFYVLLAFGTLIEIECNYFCDELSSSLESIESIQVDNLMLDKYILKICSCVNRTLVVLTVDFDIFVFTKVTCKQIECNNKFQIKNVISLNVQLGEIYLIEFENDSYEIYYYDNELCSYLLHSEYTKLIENIPVIKTIYILLNEVNNLTVILILTGNDKIVIKYFKNNIVEFDGFLEDANVDMSAPEECTPEECTPEECAPEDCAPKHCILEECAPKHCILEDCAPKHCIHKKFKICNMTCIIIKKTRNYIILEVEIIGSKYLLLFNFQIDKLTEMPPLLRGYGNLSFFNNYSNKFIINSTENNISDEPIPFVLRNNKFIQKMKNYWICINNTNKLSIYIERWGVFELVYEFFKDAADAEKGCFDVLLGEDVDTSYI